MTDSLVSRPAVMWWSTRRSRRLLVAAHLPFFAIGPLLTVVGFEEQPRSFWLVVPLGIVIGVLQLRHSFAAARGLRPTGWPVTLLAMAILVYLPMPWFQWDWATTQIMFIASATMLLRGQVQKVFIAAPLLGTPLFAVIFVGSSISGALIRWECYLVCYWTVILAGGSACLYGATVLVRAVDTLFKTRGEMAEMSVGRERLRVSRDLHDLLGQSLSAVSLKGDLAIALLQSDLPAAEAEIRSLTNVAREAQRDIRHVVIDKHPITLQNEIQSAAVLLAAASIQVEVEVQLEDLVLQVDQLFGWAVIEGVTNMLRHSEAATCSIRATRQGSRALLEIVNDGVRSTIESGTGIVGLHERALALSGHVEGGLMSDGRYRLLVEVPKAFG